MPTRQASTPAELLEIVRRSGLIEPERCDDLAASLPEKARRSVQHLARHLVSQGVVTVWQAQHLLAGRSKGYFLGRYKLLKLLGTGGMGRVFLAEHTYLKRLVALKLLTDADADSPRLRRFFRESQAVATLNHPHICQVHDFDTDGRFHFLVQEYLEGPDLQQLVEQNGPLDARLAIDYTRQAAEALDHAHRHGMIHRDVKPANLMLDGRGVLKLVDLGVVRWQRGSDPTITADHAMHIIGTVDYLPPEQFLDGHNVDARADLYSLGCTLFYLLAGRPPFDRGTQQQRIILHQTEAPPSLSGLRPHVPRELVELCEQLLAKRPEDRPQTAAEVATRLRDLAASLAEPRIASPLAPRTRLHIHDEPALPATEDARLVTFLEDVVARVRGGEMQRVEQLLLATPTNWLTDVFGPVRGAKLGRDYHERRGLLRARLIDFFTLAAAERNLQLSVAPITTASLRASDLDRPRRAVGLWTVWFATQGRRVSLGPLAPVGSGFGLLWSEPTSVQSDPARTSARKRAV
jgi:hypothetical protein